jgi:hypothetical protein
LTGVNIVPNGVRGGWLRHAMETRYKRPMRLEQCAQGDALTLSEQQINRKRQSNPVIDFASFTAWRQLSPSTAAKPRSPRW